MVLTANNKSTKRLIIETLGQRFPLTLNQIAKAVRATKNISYQAVHKAIKELTTKNITEKIDKQFVLNKDWLSDQTSAFAAYYTEYFNINYNANQIQSKSKIQVFRFNSLKQLLDFFVKAIAHGQLAADQDIYISVRRLHPLIPQSLIRIIRTLLKGHTIYILCANNNAADRWTAQLFRSLGVKVKTGIKIPHQNAICSGDTVLQYFIFFPESYKNKVHAFSDTFSASNSIKLLKMSADIFTKKTDIYVILNRYPVFVNDIREAITKEFEHERTERIHRRGHARPFKVQRQLQ